MAVTTSAAVPRGAFIVLEGGDRSGKSTQCELLAQALRTRLQTPVELLKFPDRSTAIGQSINAYLTQSAHLEDHVAHLLFSANRWEVADHMERLLISGSTIVADRYAFSGVAFSAAKGLELEWCKAPDVGLIRPDVTIYLDVPVETASARGGFGDELYEKEAIQTRVRKIFMDQLRDDHWRVVDGRRSKEEIAHDIFAIAKSVVEIAACEPLHKDLFVKS